MRAALQRAMTGGWQRAGQQTARRRLDEEEVAARAEQWERLDAALAWWLDAARFRRRVDRALRRKGITFAQWRVLRTASRLTEGPTEGVSQRAIGERIQMDANTISAIVKRLTEKGLIDWDVLDRDWSYLILVTKKGYALLEKTERVVLSAVRAS